MIITVPRRKSMEVMRFLVIVFMKDFAMRKDIILLIKIANAGYGDL